MEKYEGYAVGEWRRKMPERRVKKEEGKKEKGKKAIDLIHTYGRGGIMSHGTDGKHAGLSGTLQLRGWAYGRIVKVDGDSDHERRKRVVKERTVTKGGPISGPPRGRRALY